MDIPLIALDGPSGVGKSSTARALAERLGYYFLSSGQIYRALAWRALALGWHEGVAIPAAVLEDTDVQVEPDGALAVNGQRVTDELRSEAVSRAASLLSTDERVRAVSNTAQRGTVTRIARRHTFPGVVIEGRDMGTVVFPEARHKFFITASPAERARRRYRELAASNPGLDVDTVERSLMERDERDSTREVAPLKPAPDAEVVDTSGMTLEQVVAHLVAAIRTREAG